MPGLDGACGTALAGRPPRRRYLFSAASKAVNTTALTSMPRITPLMSSVVAAETGVNDLDWPWAAIQINPATRATVTPSFNAGYCAGSSVTQGLAVLEGVTGGAGC